MGELPNCPGCLFCNPQDYKIEVDGFFLSKVHEALVALERYAPEHSAPGWLEMCNRTIKELEAKHGGKLLL